ncbi:hypothetical protein C6Y45_13940 [Alkalicoccus saliphilus]|uniref:Uncharacterized protein n=1 Tax=Alkalicoccus saliphilus TaxID=200989 RepID=A0A2T4U3H1_9BACI|nr:hypothetical protein C6Y45_13940 [Alkalicoccus saliphilus]
MELAEAGPLGKLPMETKALLFIFKVFYKTVVRKIILYIKTFYYQPKSLRPFIFKAEAFLLFFYLFCRHSLLLLKENFFFQRVLCGKH